MENLEKLQILAQLLDHIEAATEKLDEVYKENDIEKFNHIKQEILGFQEKISEILE